MENEFFDFDEVGNETGPLTLENDFNEMLMLNNDFDELSPEEKNELINEILDAMNEGEYSDELDTDEYDTGDGIIEKTGSP